MAGWKIPELNGGFDLGKSLINGPFSIAMFDYRNVLQVFPFVEPILVKSLNPVAIAAGKAHVSR